MKYQTKGWQPVMVTSALIVLIVANAVAGNEPPAGAEPSEGVKNVLEREVWFMSTVGELSPDENRLLADEAKKALHRWGARIESNSLAASLRRELTPLLKSISHEGWEKFDAERVRLEERHYHATILAQVAEYDESLLLTNEQREKLCAELAETARGIGWQARESGPPLFPARRLPPEISSGGLGRFEPAKARFTAVLTPAQVSAWQQLQGPVGPHVVLTRPEARPATVGIHPPLDEHCKRLNVVLERFVDAADAACGLEGSQRQKLLLAGQIDIDRFAEEYRRIESQATDDAAKHEARLAALSNQARTMFVDHDSSFQRALRARLTTEQRAKLAIAERSRHDFRLQALAESVVVGFERSAALTSAQCIELHQMLQKAAVGGPATPHWQLDCLRAITRLPHENLQPIFADQQWPAIERQLMQLEEVAQQLDEEKQNKVGVLRFVDVLVVGDDGQVKSQIEADEIRLRID